MLESVLLESFLAVSQARSFSEAGRRLGLRQSTISQDNRADRSMMDHLAIIEALERRDTERAEALVRKHTLDLAAHVERYCTYLD